MTLTAPGGISNSGSRPFSNLFGRIAMDNYNIVLESENSYAMAGHKSQPRKSSKKYPKYTPKSVSEVIASTRLG